MQIDIIREQVMSEMLDEAVRCGLRGVMVLTTTDSKRLMYSTETRTLANYLLEPFSQREVMMQAMTTMSKLMTSSHFDDSVVYPLLPGGAATKKSIYLCFVAVSGGTGDVNMGITKAGLEKFVELVTDPTN